MEQSALANKVNSEVAKTIGSQAVTIIELTSNFEALSEQCERLKKRNQELEERLGLKVNQDKSSRKK
ncbi:hypothetical protein ACTHQ4_10115 [Alkalicoccobacillus gibsonii]|uniref:hypothetical protein n=1 Tax=Alkalicoccobacillus gibsonii TaxID=79881 RepID=UPI003F7C4EE2